MRMATRMLIANLSVWESLETLRQFALRGSHLEAFRRRAEWFENVPEPTSVLWWIEAGTTPTVLGDPVT